MICNGCGQEMTTSAITYNIILGTHVPGVSTISAVPELNLVHLHDSLVLPKTHPKFSAVLELLEIPADQIPEHNPWDPH